jgi:cytochrome c1
MIGVVGVVLVALSFMPLGTQATNQALAAHGKAVFQAKGCASCHVHQAVAASRNFGYLAGPDLSNYRADPAYLQRWLRDPQAVKPTATMPNLNLNDDEITALIAFLNENEQQ